LKKELTKLEDLAKAFSNPASFAYHVGKDILVNGVQIYHEIKDSIVQYDAGNYQLFGEDIGRALAQILIGGKMQKAFEMASNPNMVTHMPKFL